MYWARRLPKFAPVSVLSLPQPWRKSDIDWDSRNVEYQVGRCESRELRKSEGWLVEPAVVAPWVIRLWSAIGCCVDGWVWQLRRLQDYRSALEGGIFVQCLGICRSGDPHTGPFGAFHAARTWIPMRMGLCATPSNRTFSTTFDDLFYMHKYICLFRSTGMHSQLDTLVHPFTPSGYELLLIGRFSCWIWLDTHCSMFSSAWLSKSRSRSHKTGIQFACIYIGHST